MYASMQRPNAEKMSKDLFSQLDTNGQGYIEEGDLKSALDKVTSSKDSSSTLSAKDMFSQLDTDGDGKVTEQELASTFQSLADEMGVRARIAEQNPQRAESDAPSHTLEELTQMSTSDSVDENMQGIFSQLADNFDSADSDGNGSLSGDEAITYLESQGVERKGPPPGPPPTGDTSGLSQDELTSMSTSDSIDTVTQSILSQLADNFDAADTNEDGKVSMAESAAYLNKDESSNQGATNTMADDNNRQLMNTLTELLKAYGSSSEEQDISLFTATA
tara:strand:- start:127619 stop:128446 length:828 start_codon:yes stop_codon:yes gene_type:complete